MSSGVIDYSGKTIWFHDPTNIREIDGGYLLYVTAGGSGRGIEERYLPKGSDKWEDMGLILIGEDKPEWFKSILPINDGAFWAPDLPLIGNQWVLYYSIYGMTDDGVAAIGRATATGEPPELVWVDDGEPVVYCDDLTVLKNIGPTPIDPSVMLDYNGRLWMAYGSYCGGIWIVELDPETGHMVHEAGDRWTPGNTAYTHIAASGRNQKKPPSTQRPERENDKIKRSGSRESFVGFKNLPASNVVQFVQHSRCSNCDNVEH